jgi:hypothetical protein
MQIEFGMPYQWVTERASPQGTQPRDGTLNTWNGLL